MIRHSLRQSLLSLIPVGLITVLMVFAVAAASPSYILGTGDKLRITVFGEPDLSGEFEVGASGAISLPPIGDVSTTDSDLRQLERPPT